MDRHDRPQLALLPLLHARSAARVTAGGSLARLAEQDRRLALTANPVEQAFLDARHAAVLAPGVD